MYIWSLTRSLKVLLLISVIITALILGEAFFKPLVLSALFAILFLPLCKWMEKKGLPRGVAACICVLIIILSFAGLIAVVSWQVADLAKDLSQVQQQVKDLISEVKNTIQERFGISTQQQEQILEDQKQNASAGGGNIIGAVLGSFSAFIISFILLIIYTLLLLVYRRHFKKFILMLFAEKHRAETEIVLSKTAKVVQQYLGGLAAMIVCLWVLYGIAFSIIGIRHAIFFAVLAGTLEIIPFVGNFTGSGLTAVMALVQGGGIQMALWVALSYASIQLIQNYVLTPLIVGYAVNINPFFIIASLIAGNLIWGLTGMAICIPVTAIIKIICDHTEALKPFGYLLGKEKKKKKVLMV